MDATGDMPEAYLLAVTLAATGDDPSEADYAAWDRVRELANDAGLPALPPLLPNGLRMLLRCALLGADGLLVGWEPDSLSDAMRLAGEADPSALATFVSCLAMSGMYVGEGEVRAARLLAEWRGASAVVSEADRACARLLLPDRAPAIVAAEMLA